MRAKSFFTYFFLPSELSVVSGLALFNSCICLVTEVIISGISFIDKSYNIETISSKDTIIKSIPVSLSKTESYDIKTSNDITKFLPADYNKTLIKVAYTGKESLSYKDKINTKIGTITYSYNEEIISTEDVILTKELKPDYLKIVLEYKFIIITAIIIIIAIALLILILTITVKES